MADCLSNDDDFDMEPPAFITAPTSTSSHRPDLSAHRTQSSGSAPNDQNDTVRFFPTSLIRQLNPQTVLWFTAGAAGAFICRQLCHGLWIPRVRNSGIATHTLRDFVHSNSQWRDKYIAKLGVPLDWPQEWDFLAAISSCSTEAYYHSLWMIVHQAIEDYGLEDEKKDRGAGVGDYVELDSLRRRIMEESEHSALRVASLISVLTENGYLRLDPYVHPSRLETSANKQTHSLASSLYRRSHTRSCRSSRV